MGVDDDDEGSSADVGAGAVNVGPLVFKTIAFLSSTV